MFQALTLTKVASSGKPFLTVCLKEQPETFYPSSSLLFHDVLKTSGMISFLYLPFPLECKLQEETNLPWPLSQRIHVTRA